MTTSRIYDAVYEAVVLSVDPAIRSGDAGAAADAITAAHSATKEATYAAIKDVLAYVEADWASS